MVKSTEIVENIQNALSLEDRKFLEGIFAGLQEHNWKKSRKTLVNEINCLIIHEALKNNRPSILSGLQYMSGCEIDIIFSKIVCQFIHTKNISWLEYLVILSSRLEKKSYQSRVFALMAHDLIDAGVSEGSSFLIDHGLIMFERVIFRKYRSEIMIEIIPLLIEWAVTNLDEKVLYRSLKSIKEISDISKRAMLHAELAKAIAAIAIPKKDRDLFFQSIRIAAKIHQKIRRQNCLSTIIENGAKSVFEYEMFDVKLFLKQIPEVSHDKSLEIISALAKQLLERVKDKKQIMTTLQNICRDDPLVIHTIVKDLLIKAEKSGDFWCLSSALQLQEFAPETDEYPIREMVRAGISIARSSNNMQVLKDLIPFINKKCNSTQLSRIYLQFSKIMLSSGDFNSALEMFTKICDKTDYQSQFIDDLICLIKSAFIQDHIRLIKDKVLDILDIQIVNIVIYRTIIEIIKDLPFNEINLHITSLKELISLHPEKDHLFLECITLLANRGFLDSNDPGVLIKLVDNISDPNMKERAISMIVIKIARIGVQTKNRDFLQRAVGLTCIIEGQKTRSITLSSVIDDASILAAQDGDLDLLLRMKVWSNTLLEKDLEIYAKANIISGILKCAIGRKSPDAVEQALLIADNICDPILRTQLYERISECYVIVGCTILQRSKIGQTEDNFGLGFRSFERGLDIIKQNFIGLQISLKIAGMLDIMIAYSCKSENPDYIIALAMYTVEIENNFERDAMMHRIISNLNDNIPHPNSTDPYEIIAYLLRKNEHAESDTRVIQLIFKIVNRITNVFTKLSGFCSIANISIQSKDPNSAYRMLNNVCLSIPLLQTEYEKILILTDLTSLFCQFDKKMASICLLKGIRHLETVEEDKNAMARKIIVMAIANLYIVNPDKELTAVASQVTSKIVDPVEYIHSLIAIHGMNEGNHDKCSEILRQIILATDNISLPYDIAIVLLDIFPLSLNESEDEIPLIILKKAEMITNEINIKYISDTILEKIADNISILYDRENKKEYRSFAIEVIKLIDNDEIRLRRLTELGYDETYDVQPHYLKIRNLCEKIAKGRVHSNQITLLERLTRSISDRGRVAILFCDCALIFRKEGEEKLSKRMMQSSMKEARIIRPLSRRAYVMCDIAMKISEDGSEREAQEILDHAIDAATNIRQSPLRDEVFEELGLAIKIIQEME